MTGTSSGSSSSGRNRLGARGGRLVLLDTNALLLPVRSHFPLEAEIQRLRPGAVIEVPSSVLGELDRLALRGVPGARAAVALARRFRVFDVAGRGDLAIVEAAEGSRAAVVTADRALANRLRSQGVEVLAPRDRHRLERMPGRPLTARPAPRTRRP
jgi:rRNA-processing protein FCF1